MLASFEQALNIECDESNYGQFPLLGLLNTTTDHDTLRIVFHYYMSEKHAGSCIQCEISFSLVFQKLKIQLVIWKNKMNQTELGINQ